MNTPEPMACRYCDVPRREHCNRWHKIMGYHKWTAPEQWQVKARMERRRRLTGRPLPKRWVSAFPPPPAICDHSGPYEVDTDADGWPILTHPCGHVEGYTTWWGGGGAAAEYVAAHLIA